MVYLNDDYKGGNTQFHYHCQGDTKLAHSVVPSQGTVLVFNHDAWYH